MEYWDQYLKKLAMNEDEVIAIISSVLGADEEDILSESEFEIDLHANLEEINEIKKQIEQLYDIVLPFDDENAFPDTVGELLDMVHDSCL